MSLTIKGLEAYEKAVAEKSSTDSSSSFLDLVKIPLKDAGHALQTQEKVVAQYLAGERSEEELFFFIREADFYLSQFKELTNAGIKFINDVSSTSS